MKLISRIVIFLIAIVCAAPSLAEPRVGNVRMNFGTAGRSLTQGKIAKMLRRSDAAMPLDLRQESYGIYVPQDYKAGMPHGVMVYIDTADLPALESSWTSTLENRHVIWLSPNGAGRNEPLSKRLALAIDAIDNLKEHYAIDTERVYICGRHCGSVVGAVAMMSVPEVFKGAVITDTRFYRDINTHIDGLKYSAAKDELFSAPPRRSLSTAKRSSRVVIMFPPGKAYRTMNMATFNKGWKTEGFRYLANAKNVDMTDMVITGKSFDAAIQYMDAPLTKTAASHFRKGQSYEKTKKIGLACGAYALAAMRGGGTKEGGAAVKRFDELYPQFMETVTKRENEITALINKGDFVKAVAEIRKAKTAFGTLGEAAIKRLNVKYDAARKRAKGK